MQDWLLKEENDAVLEKLEGTMGWLRLFIGVQDFHALDEIRLVGGFFGGGAHQLIV